MQFLLDHLLNAAAENNIDRTRIGMLGHSFGGWTALAAPDFDRRIRAVVALAPPGASRPKPGILPVKLTFDWGRDVPTLYLVAENDSAIPLAGMHEIFERTPSTKQMFILHGADHLHFMDNVEELHETVRKMRFPGTDEMKPICGTLLRGTGSDICAGLTLCHMDAVLKHREEEERFLGP